MPASRSRPAIRLCGLPPLASPAPRILILGSFPSALSLTHREYYANPRNRFWGVMEAVTRIPASLPYGDRTRLLAEVGIALWDVVQCCERQGSADSRIRDPAVNDIPAFIRNHPGIRLIALNGSTAGRLYHRLGVVPDLPSVTLPSTSPANAVMTFAEKVRQWQEGLLPMLPPPGNQGDKLPHNGGSVSS